MAIAFPWFLALLSPIWLHLPPLVAASLAAAGLLLPPSFLLGATLPAVAAALPDGRAVAAVYASNTAGAVLGTLAGPFLLLPAVGIRRTEILAASCSALAGVAALVASRIVSAPERPPAPPTPTPWPPLVAV